MDKLIELLNECKWKSYRFGVNGDNSIYQKETDAYGNIHIIVLPDYKLISKKFGFIQWLVDNDKIDVDEINCQNIPYYSYIDEEGYVSFKHFGFYEQLLMLLSIQDNPIEFLVSILK